MPSLLPIVVGPELYWLTIYLIFRRLAHRNVPPTAEGNDTLNSAVWLAAAIAIPLSFAFYALPGNDRWILLVRLGITALLGFNACAVLAVDWIKYPEPGRNSGLLALWIAGAGLAFFTWLISAVVSIVLLRAGAH